MADNPPPNPFQPYNEMIAAILAELQAFGLRPQDFSSAEFEGRATLADNGDLDDLFVDTVTWLRDEGLVRLDGFYSGTEDESVAGRMVLTAKALHYLKAPLDALGGETPGAVLAKNKSGDTSVSNWIKLGSFLGSGLGGFTKSIS
jgi:hypothetical protein